MRIALPEMHIAFNKTGFMKMWKQFNSNLSSMVLLYSKASKMHDEFARSKVIQRITSQYKNIVSGEDNTLNNLKRARTHKYQQFAIESCSY